MSRSMNTKMHIWCRFCDTNSNPLKLSWRQVKFHRILIQNGQNDLEGQGHWPPCSLISAESVPGCMFGANLMIPAQIFDELSCGQGKVYGQTDGQTDIHRQRQYPFGLKGQRVKTCAHVIQRLYNYMFKEPIFHVSYPCTVGLVRY